MPAESTTNDSDKEVESEDDMSKPLERSQIQCTANGRRPMESDFEHCLTPQTFVRCGPHHRAELCVFTDDDINELYDVWWAYRDDLSWPWYEKKPQFDDKDFETLRRMGQKVVDAMIDEYGQPMVLDQCTISNTNHIGHPPHADNVQFDSVWWSGKRIRQEDEVTAAQEGAYVLWRTEKTSYRTYSCSVALTDPSSCEGGEVQFFEKWGDKDPVASYKCAKGCGIAFCGCNRNIHAVTGVKSGFRLVFLVWTRPPDVRVPDNQTHVCYFRPGTGYGVWLTTADMLRYCARKHRRIDKQAWVPKEDDNGICQCEKCTGEREKISWADCCPAREKVETCAIEDESTSASNGNSPRLGETDSPSSPSHETVEHTNADVSMQQNSKTEDVAMPQTSPTEDLPMQPPALKKHCPHPPCRVSCKHHGRVGLTDVLSSHDMQELRWIWDAHKDDLTHPWYDKKPTFTDYEFLTFRSIAQKVVNEMSALYKEPLVLDQATISNTNHLGHPPHADNVQFDSVWWEGRQIKQKDELTAARGGAEVMWRDSKTSYRNYSASVGLTDPEGYGGGFLEFYHAWGQKDPDDKVRHDPGCGVSFCGCAKSIHAVTGVTWGFRLVLLIWTRPQDAVVPDEQKHVCYFRPGTGNSVWLTTADLENYPGRIRKHKSNSRDKHSSWSWNNRHY